MAVRRRRLAARLPDPRRAGFLACFGIAHIVLGISFLTAATGGPLSAIPVPMWAHAVPWVLSGCAALLSSVWPPGRDSWGFATLVIIEVAWAGTWLVLWVTGATGRGWVTAVMFAAMAAAVATVSGMVAASSVTSGREIKA
jgi:hypothetical protein